VWITRGSVWNRWEGLIGIGIASLVQIATSSDRRNQVDARRVFWLMLDACKSPNSQFQILPPESLFTMRFDLGNPFSKIRFSDGVGERTHFASAFIFRNFSLGISRFSIWRLDLWWVSGWSDGVKTPDSCDLFIRVKLFQFHPVIRLDKGGNDKVVTGLTLFG